MAEKVRGWLQRLGVGPLLIGPGSLADAGVRGRNGYNESFKGKLRDGLLNGELLDTLREAQVLVERWRSHYDTVRPHSAPGYVPPAPEAAQPWPPGFATLSPPATAEQTAAAG